MLRKIIICLIAASIFGLLPLPFSYYVLLRLLYFSSLIYLGYAIYEKDKSVSPILISICLLSLLYNPVFLVHLGSKLLWAAINLATIVFVFVISKRKKLIR